MITTEKWSGRIALMAGHCAGMLDMIALPIWMATLIGFYRFNPQQAGLLITLLFAAVVVVNIFLSSQFNKLNARLMTTVGFTLSGLAFVLASRQHAFVDLAATYVLAGMGLGSALAFTHGTIGRSANPHRLFALVNTALCCFALVFMGLTPLIIQALGSIALMWIFAGIMFVAAAAAALFFPQPTHPAAAKGPLIPARLGRAVWAGILGVSLMAITQAMIFSFIQQIGLDHGFGQSTMASVLFAIGLVSLFPAPLAALLQKRLPAEGVVLVGPLVQAGIALVVTLSVSFLPFALGAVLFNSVIVFTHTFAFGLLSRLDPSGRTVAATAAVLMIGSTIGPFLGGTLVATFGYPALGIAAVFIAIASAACFSQARGSRPAVTTTTSTAVEGQAH